MVKTNKKMPLKETESAGIILKQTQINTGTPNDPKWNCLRAP